MKHQIGQFLRRFYRSRYDIEDQAAADARRERLRAALIDVGGKPWEIAYVVALMDHYHATGKVGPVIRPRTYVSLHTGDPGRGPVAAHEGNFARPSTAWSAGEAEPVTFYSPQTQLRANGLGK